MKLVLDNGQEIDVEFDLPDTATVTDVVVGASVVDFEENSEYMAFGSNPGASSATRLGLGYFLSTALVPKEINGLEE